MWVKNAFALWPSIVMVKLVTLAICGSVLTDNWKYAEEDFRSHLDEGQSCQIKTGEAGICKIITSCEFYYNALKNKSIAYSFLVRCSFTDLDEVICCPLNNTPITNPDGRTKGGISLFNTRPTEPAPIRDRPSQAACRKYTNAIIVPHIVGGLPVSPGEYPHMGGLIVGGGGTVDNHCGSSLITDRYLLTAAHCFNDPLLLPTFVRLGVVLWNSTDDGEEGDGILPVDVEIEKITMHSQYLSHLRYHDIALIKLRNAVEFTPFIRPACLYSDPSDIDSNTPLVVIGWGVTNIQTRVRSEALLQTKVTTDPLQHCNATHISYGTSRSYRKGLIDGHYCAYDRELKKDACQADSGGPLQLVGEKGSTIVGIVSFGHSCASEIPSVYTRVAHYLDWIESIVWP